MDKDKAMGSPFKDPEKRKQYQQQYHKEKWYPLHREERMKRSRQQRADLVKWYQDYKNRGGKGTVLGTYDKIEREAVAKGKCKGSKCARKKSFRER